MSEIKLLPCPFCGYHGTLNTTNIGETFYAVCMKCGSRTIDFKTIEEAIKKWNTRKPMERIIEKLEDKKWGTSEWRDKWRDEIIGECIEVIKEEGGIE